MNRNVSKRRNDDFTKGQNKFDRLWMMWKRWRGYRALIIPLLVVALYFTAKTFYSGDESAVQLKFIETQSEQSGPSAITGAESFKPVLSGEAYETAARLRESGALLMAIALSSFEEFRLGGKFPATAAETLTGLQKRLLLPPGIEIKDGTPRSALSEMKLTYRAEPFSFEIVSLPINANGSAILFRFPLPPTEANSVMYFEARNPVQLAEPFSTSEQLTAAGWKIRHWRSAMLPLNERVVRDLREQDEWFRTRNQGR